MGKDAKREAIMQVALTLFSVNGFYKTTIPDIAKRTGMSVGNIYNYFPSKEKLAQEIIKYSSKYISKQIKKINANSSLTTYEKIQQIVKLYFEMSATKPEMIEYFLRVFLSSGEVFFGTYDKMVYASDFVTEIMIFFEDGIKQGDLREQNFFAAFTFFVGYLGGMIFLHSDGILNQSLEEYMDDISQNIFNALKSS